MTQNEYVKRALLCEFNYLFMDNNHRYYFCINRNLLEFENFIDCSLYIYEMNFFQSMIINEFVSLYDLIDEGYIQLNLFK